MKSWLGEGIRRRLESRKHQPQAQLFSDTPNSEVQPVAQAADEQPTEAPKDVTSREVPTLEAAKRDGTGSDSEPCLKASALLSAPSVPITASRRSDTAQALSAKPDVEQPPSWWWARFVGVRDTNRVSLQDTGRCVQLVVAELRGVVAPEITYQFQGDSVSLREIY